MISMSEFKKIWFVIFLGAAVALGFIFYANNSFHQEFLAITISYGPGTIVKQEPKKAWVEIDLGKSKRLFEGKLGNKAYALGEVLKSLAKDGGFIIKIKGGEITAVNGTAGPWKIYKNGVSVNDPLNKLAIKAGDKYTLRIGK